MILENCCLAYSTILDIVKYSNIWAHFARIHYNTLKFYWEKELFETFCLVLLDYIVSNMYIRVWFDEVGTLKIFGYFACLYYNILGFD